jgi:gliding motility-associated-like protein
VIHPLPTADFNTSLPAITCNDAEVDITVSGGVSYQWSDGLGNSDVVTVTDDATISVIVTDEYSCESTASISVPYDTSSFAIIDVATTTLNCAVLDIDLDIIGGSIFQWYDVISDSSSISISTPGVYGAHVTHDNGCTRDVYITIDQDITPPTIQIQNLTGVDTLTCLTTEIQLQALGGVSYTWNNGMGNGAIANVVNPGEYIVVGTGANFCTSDTSYSISQNIVQPTPSLSGSDNLLDCFVDSILMVASGGVNYSWNLSALTDDSLMVTLPGNYEVTVFAPNGCSSTAQWNVGLNRYSPDSAFVYSPQVIMDEDALVNLDGPSINGVAYQWTIDDDVVFNGDDFTYTFGSFSPGVHEVCMRAFVSELCKSDSCQQIEIFESLQLFLPTSFTPGNDGVNDGYSPVFSNIDLIENYDLVIFNRWGEVLFHSVNPTESWDGNYKEDGMYYVPDGSYPYILNYKTYRDIEMITVKGNIVIVR